MKVFFFNNKYYLQKIIKCVELFVSQIRKYSSKNRVYPSSAS